MVKMSFSLCFFVVERRRRDKINNWIVTLSKIIPDCSVDSRTGAVSAGQRLKPALIPVEVIKSIWLEKSGVLFTFVAHVPNGIFHHKSCVL